MQIQLDLPEELNRRLKIYRIENSFRSIKDAAIDALSKFFIEHTADNISRMKLEVKKDANRNK